MFNIILAQCKYCTYFHAPVLQFSACSSNKLGYNWDAEPLAPGCEIGDLLNEKFVGLAAVIQVEDVVPSLHLIQQIRATLQPVLVR